MLSQEVYLGKDQSFRTFVSCTSELEPNTRNGTRNDVHIAQGNRGEVDLIQLDLGAIFLLHGGVVCLKDFFHELWDLIVEPLLGALDTVPENQVFAENLL